MDSDHAGPSRHPNVQGWPSAQAEVTTQYAHRKTVPIKRSDAEPLTRKDVQYAALHYIFADKTRVFTDPSPGKADNKINFAELYIGALFNSSKCSKVLKDKMAETPAFALEFAKICLLTNVGRINTTMAFFPEMKTALRSYHPVPSLQKTDGNAQDAPRIKNCLKAALLPTEFRSGPPSTPAEVITKVQSGQKPPTSIVNLIFVLANHASSLPHFDPPTDFLDLFMPVELSSASRAHAFLWLIFHYLEGTDVANPFSDDYARQHPGKVPLLQRITAREMEEENMDPPDEIEWGRKMSQLRGQFLQKLVNQTENERRNVSSPAPPPPPRDLAPRRHRTQHPPVHQSSRGETFHHYVPKERDQSRSRNPPRSASVVPSGHSSMVNPVTPDPEHSMLHQAWFSVNTADPLLDSDEEFADENVRVELQRRLGVITRLRGKSPTPSPPPEERGYDDGIRTEEGPHLEGQNQFTGQWQQAQWD